MNFLRKSFLLGLALSVLILPVFAFARLGVGVGVGKIQVEKPLKAGIIYDLPSLPVLNTGDEPSDYGVSIEYHEKQEENPEMGLRPAKEWFSFEPANFHLEPGQSQQVKMKLALPIKGVKPGKYFVYLEAHPIRKAETGATQVGIAAAAKLYFTVAPSNIFQGIYYRFLSLYLRYHPWDTIALVIIFLTVLFRFLGKKFKIQITKKS